jgi:hypothetical protein
MPASTPERGGRNAGAIIAGAMDSEAVEPLGAAAERVVGHTRVSAAQLASVLSRTSKVRRSLMRMPRDTSRLGEVMMLRRSVERLAVLVRRRGRLARMRRNGANPPRGESRRARARGLCLRCGTRDHPMRRGLLRSPRAEQPLLTVVGVHVGHTAPHRPLSLRPFRNEPRASPTGCPPGSRFETSAIPILTAREAVPPGSDLSPPSALRG